MVTDTEVPTAPLLWAESIHGDLVLVDRVQADGWKQQERGQGTAGDPFADGSAALVECGAGVSLRLATPEGSSATTVETAESGVVYVITDLAGSGHEPLREAATQIPDEKFVNTGKRLTVGFVGLVLYDGAASWEMVSGSMLYVYADAKKGEYEIDVCASHEADGREMRVLRLRPA